MPAQIDTEERQPALGARFSHHARARHRGGLEAGMVGNIKIVLDRRLEALHPIPCQVLDAQKGPVAHQDVVQPAMADKGTFAALNYSW